MGDSVDFSISNKKKPRYILPVIFMFILKMSLTAALYSIDSYLQKILSKKNFEFGKCYSLMSYDGDN